MFHDDYEEELDERDNKFEDEEDLGDIEEEETLEELDVDDHGHVRPRRRRHYPEGEDDEYSYD